MSNTIDSKRQAVEDEDGEYVRACQNGDTDAFKVLVERHQKKMLNIAYRMLGDYDDACDVTQEAFVAAYKSIKKFKAEAKFSTWLYRIVINYTKNRLKQQKSRRSHENIIDEAGEGKTDCATCLNSTAHEQPDARMMQKEREAKVQMCIEKLDNEYKEVLVLRDIQGFSYEEICAILKIPDGTVKSRLSRARGALKDCLVKVIGDL
ncbi:MAG: sigma-70 family RNA polymerase sigma factor [Syntrophaceae bacterium]|nr:sigma-70 family RNA polymerase sigma factor [Syntrophaceae bacterium]